MEPTTVTPTVLASLLATLLYLASPSAGLTGYGPFVAVPSDASKCPAACKVRDVSLYGAGTQTTATTADACIDMCKALANTHYTFSTQTSTCGCGNCTGGFVTGSSNSGVVAGQLSSCKKYPSCSNLITATNPAQVCKCPGTTTCNQKSSLTFYCCCVDTYPVVMSNQLKSCSTNGA